MKNLFMSISILCVLVCLASCSMDEKTDNNLSDVKATNSVQDQTQPQSDMEETSMQTANEPYTKDTSISDVINDTPNSKFDGKQDYRAAMPQYTEEGYEKAKGLLEFLTALAEEKGATMGQLSLAWMICKKPYIVPIPGSRKAERLQETLTRGTSF